MALGAMIELFGMKQLRHPTQIGFDGEALIPRAALTQFDVARLCVLFPQAQVCQRNRLTIIPTCQRSKDVVGLIGSVPTPVDHLTSVVDQPGQLDADNPAPVRLAFLANLLFAATLAARMEQLDAISVQHGKEAWVAQERQDILGMVAKQALQACPLRLLRKEAAIISTQPAVQGAKAATFQAKQQSDRDNLAGKQMSIGTLVDMTQMVIYHAKQADDNLVRRHTVLL